MLGTFNPNGIFYSNFNVAELNKKSFAAQIMRLFPNGSAMMYPMTGYLKKSVAKSVMHGYFTKHMAYPSLTLNGAVLAADTTFTVDSTAGIVVGATFQVPTTREIIRVNSITDSTHVAVDRSFGRIAAADIADNTVLKLVGSAATEGSDRPTSRNLATAWVPNYTVIVRNAYAVTDTARAEMTELGYGNLAETRLDAAEFHSVDIEGNMIFGQALQPTVDLTTGKRIHATQGFIDSVYQYAADNVMTAGATTNYQQLVDMIKPPYRYAGARGGGGGVKERVMLCDSQALDVINAIGINSASVQMQATETTFGMQYTAFRHPRGMIRVLESGLLNELAPTAGIALIVDLTSVGVAYLEGRDAKRESYYGTKDGSNSGVDAQGGSLTSEFATEFVSPQTCGIINGLTKGV